MTRGMTRRMPRRMPRRTSGGLPRGLPCWLLSGFLSGMLCGIRRDRNEWDLFWLIFWFGYEIIGNTDRCIIVGVLRCVAVFENQCAGEVNNRYVPAKGIGLILVENVPVFQYGVHVGCVTHAVCLAPGTGTWTGIIARCHHVKKGSSWGFCGSAGTITGLVCVEID